MKKPPDQLTTCLQLQRARELMAQGKSDQALVVALSALQTALNNLKDSLLSLQNNLALMRINFQKVELSQEEKDSRDLRDLEMWPRTYH